jgi:hypothetical protein
VLLLQQCSGLLGVKGLTLVPVKVAAADHAGKNFLLNWFINGKWANIMHFLGCVLCMAFSVAWNQVGLAGIAGGAVAALQLATLWLLRLCLCSAAIHSYACLNGLSDEV